MFYVYAYCNPNKIDSRLDVGCEPFYFGKGSKRRLYDHLRDAKAGKKGAKLSHIRNLTEGQTPPVVVKLFDNLSETHSLLLEVTLIYLFGRKDEGTGCLLNQTPGGDGAAHSAETLKRIADKLRGRKASEVERNKISAGLLGKPRSCEARKAISTALSGQKHSVERKASIKASMVAAKHLLQKKWLVTSPETSFCLVSLDYLKENNMGCLYSSFRSGRPMTRGKYKGWSLSQITTS
jgi:hypothetical protein